MNKPPDSCYFLQNKAWFMHPPTDPPEGPVVLATPCWCLKTHEAIGPDGELACPDECTGAREGYRQEAALWGDPGAPSP